MWFNTVSHPGHFHILLHNVTSRNLQIIPHSVTSRTSWYHPTVSHPGHLQMVQYSVTFRTSSNGSVVSHSGHFHIIPHSVTFRAFSHRPAQYHIPDMFKSPYAGSHPGHSLFHPTLRHIPDIFKLFYERRYENDTSYFFFSELQS
jgi:hypothetical protein